MEQKSESKTLDYQGMSQMMIYAVDQRTNTTEMLNEFRRMLSGTVVVVKEDENGDLQEYEEQKYDKLMNDVGIRENLQYLGSAAEKHSIMGNMDEEQYQSFLANNHKRYVIMLAHNKHRWGYSGDNYWLVGVMMNKIELVASRTIDNLERESMSQSVKHVERTEVPDPKRGFPYFGGG